MDDIKSILVPIDFSSCSLDALRFAAIVARLSGAEIHLLTIVEKQNYYFLGTDSLFVPPSILNAQNEHYDKLKVEIKRKLIKISEAPHLSKIKVICKVGSGIKIYKSINEYAELSNADMIIMGTMGSHGLRGTLLGSNAERVSRFAKVPVLIVNKKLDSIKKIVFASDFEKESYSIFPFIQYIARLFNSDILLLKVNTPENNAGSVYGKEIKEFNSKLKTNYREIVFDDLSASEGILNYSEKIHSDLIAIGTHEGKRVIGLFNEVVSEKTLRESNRPVLVINFNSPRIQNSN